MTDIITVKKVLSPIYCDYVISECKRLGKYEKSITEAENSKYAPKESLVRTSSSLQISFAKKLNHVDRIVYNAFNKVTKQLYRLIGHDLQGEPYDLLRYEEGQQYKTHIDYNRENGRVTAAILYLNDNYEGGETEFPRQNETIKGEQGSVVLFPAIWTHPHRAMPIKKGTKYVVVTWFR